MRHLMFSIFAFFSLLSLTGCMVYEPRPRYCAYPAYEVYDGPTVVYVRGGYGYYHRGYCR